MFPLRNLSPLWIYVIRRLQVSSDFLQEPVKWYSWLTQKIALKNPQLLNLVSLQKMYLFNCNLKSLPRKSKPQRANFFLNVSCLV